MLTNTRTNKPNDTSTVNGAVIPLDEMHVTSMDIIFVPGAYGYWIALYSAIVFSGRSAPAGNGLLDMLCIFGRVLVCYY